MNTICVKCNKCGKIHRMTVELECVGSDEREMGAELYYSGSTDKRCSCGNKIQVDAEGYEYPEGAGIEEIDYKTSGGELVRCQ